MRPVSPHSCIFMARFRATPLIFPLHLRTAGSNDFWSFHQGPLFFPFVAWLDTEEGEKEGEEEEGSFASRRMITIDPILNPFFSFCEIRDLFLFQFYDPWLLLVVFYNIYLWSWSRKDICARKVVVVVRILFAIIISIIKKIRRKLSDLISLRFNRGKWVAEIFSQGWKKGRKGKKERKEEKQKRRKRTIQSSGSGLVARKSRKGAQKAASGRNSLSLLSAAIEPITRTAVETFNRRLRPSRRLWMTKWPDPRRLSSPSPSWNGANFAKTSFREIEISQTDPFWSSLAPAGYTGAWIIETSWSNRCQGSW